MAVKIYSTEYNTNNLVSQCVLELTAINYQTIKTATSNLWHGKTVKQNPVEIESSNLCVFKWQ
jgi:hypothetical protein